MAIFMTCPACNRPGNLPDTFRGGKVKCPGCGVVTEISGSGTVRAGSTPPSSKAPSAPKSGTAPSRPAAPKPAAPPKRSLLDDLDDDGDSLPIPPPSRPSPSRSAGRPSQAAAESSGSNLPLLLGVGGGAALLLAVVVAFTTMKGASTDAGPSVPEGREAIAQAGRVNAPPRQPNFGVVNSADGGQAGGMASFSPPGSSPFMSLPTAPVLPQAEAIKRSKDATVYIKVKVGKDLGTGSGFVIRNDGNDAVLIATNRHVIHHDPNADEDDDENAPPSGGSTPKGEPTITVVFRSGEGPALEQELPATVLGKDTTGDTSRDLAILSVKGVKNPPKAIGFNRSGNPAEGTELRIYGYPFGSMLNFASKGNPAITINKASVSSLRKDDRGQLALIQIDGSVQPGNSGGPMVDEGGRLIGVTVAKLRIADNFGLAIPARHVDEILAGRIGRWTIERMGTSSSGLDLKVTTDLADPLGRLKDVKVLFAPSDGKAPPKPADEKAAAALMPDSKTFPLTIAPDRKTASARFNLPFTGDTKNVLFQIAFTNGDNQNYMTLPTVHSVPAATGRLLAQGDLVEKIKKTLTKLGELLDPDKDCKMTRGKNGLKIDIPGTLHALSPQLVDKKNKPMKNAPMTLAPVEGDFVIHVRVAGDMRPGTEQLKNPKTNKPLGLTFQGAGIVLWQDADNYIRLERSVGTTGGATLVNRVLVEVCRNGKEAGRPYYIDVEPGPLSLMLLRKGGGIRCLWSSDGKRWKALNEIAEEFPDKVKVGLVGVNISKKPFTAQFENFVLIDDKDKIDDELKEEK